MSYTADDLRRRLDQIIENQAADAMAESRRAEATLTKLEDRDRRRVQREER